jgi:hypothetical protein
VKQTSRQGSPSGKCLEEKITVDGTATKRQNHQMKIATKKITCRNCHQAELGSGDGQWKWWAAKEKTLSSSFTCFFILSQIIVDQPQPTHYRGQLCGSRGDEGAMQERKGGGVDFRMLPACLNPPPSSPPPPASSSSSVLQRGPQAPWGVHRAAARQCVEPFPTPQPGYH